VLGLNVLEIGVRRAGGPAAAFQERPYPAAKRGFDYLFAEMPLQHPQLGLRDDARRSLHSPNAHGIWLAVKHFTDLPYPVDVAAWQCLENAVKLRSALIWCHAG